MMSWLKRNYTAGLSHISSNDVVVPSMDVFERKMEFEAVVKAYHQKKTMETIAEEREMEEQALEEQVLVVDGAKIKMGSHTGEFKVLHNVPTTQGKLTGTVLENSIANFTFYDGFTLTRILNKWQHCGTIHLQDNAVLVKESTLPVVGKMPGNSPLETGIIEITDPGQVNIPENVAHTASVPVPDNEALDFDFILQHIKEDFVPFGISSFTGNQENGSIRFNIKVSGKGVDTWCLKIMHRGKLVYRLFSANAEVEKINVAATGNRAGATLTPSSSAEKQRSWPAGEYIISWNGFTKSKLYYSRMLTHEAGLTATLTAFAGHKKKQYTTVFRYAYKEVKWVDVKIDRNKRRLDISLRVNFTDGGAKGLTPTSTGFLRYTYPWDKIPKAALIPALRPINVQTHSFKELENLALKGINCHWSRNKRHFVGKDVKIHGESYEVYTEAENTKVNAMVEVYLVYNTNNPWLLSGNPGFVKNNPELAEYGVSGLWRAICYNGGYIKYADGWSFRYLHDENFIFKYTSAHEIGHQILESYAGMIYSSSHKGSVDIPTQTVKPESPDYPVAGEIDVMCYYQNGVPWWEYYRSVGAEKDVLGLVWLTKLKTI